MNELPIILDSGGNEDWIKQGSWDLGSATDLLNFLASTGQSLEWFLELPAAQAMPEDVRRDLVDLGYIEDDDEADEIALADWKEALHPRGRGGRFRRTFRAIRKNIIESRRKPNIENPVDVRNVTSEAEVLVENFLNLPPSPFMEAFGRIMHESEPVPYDEVTPNMIQDDWVATPEHNMHPDLTRIATEIRDSIVRHTGASSAWSGQIAMGATYATGMMAAAGETIPPGHISLDPMTFDVAAYFREDNPSSGFITEVALYNYGHKHKVSLDKAIDYWRFETICHEMCHTITNGQGIDRDGMTAEESFREMNFIHQSLDPNTFRLEEAVTEGLNQTLMPMMIEDLKDKLGLPFDASEIRFLRGSARGAYYKMVDDLDLAYRRFVKPMSDEEWKRIFAEDAEVTPPPFPESWTAMQSARKVGYVPTYSRNEKPKNKLQYYVWLAQTRPDERVDALTRLGEVMDETDRMFWNRWIENRYWASNDDYSRLRHQLERAKGERAWKQVAS